MNDQIYQLSAMNNMGENISLEAFKGKALLIVNTASQCGFTSQYEGLETLYQAYGNQGLEILAFPCNQFGAQEPGNDQEIAQFCELNYKTSFLLFAKIDVNGPGAHPLYQYLKSEAPGFLGSKNIKWNFTKFLVDKQGKVVARYAPQKKPQDLRHEVESLL